MRRARRQQRGIVAVMVALAMLVLLVMAGLAIDTGHLALDKSRLQSTVDAAALAAAKNLDEYGDAGLAEAAAMAVFGLNASGFDAGETLGGVDVQFSHTLDPFVDGVGTPEYVRVIASDYSVWTSFTRLLGFDEFLTRASAVAGPSAPIVNPCDLFPVAVCADLTAGPPFWGYIPYGQPGNSLVLLKLASLASGTTFGPGNFQLIRLEGTGASVVRRNMAGGAACVPPGSTLVVDPQPGNVVGAVAQGINTRFGQYAGGLGGDEARYPPDLVVTPGPATPLASADGTTFTQNGVAITGIDDVGYSYADYRADYQVENYTHPNGKPERRVVTVPIVDCSTPVPGTSGTLPVKGFGSFFLLQPVVHGGGTDAWIFGQFLGEGRASGSPGQQGGIGPYKIVLHDDPNSPDS